MSNITLIRNNSNANPEGLRQPGIVFTGKNRGTVREKLLSTGLAFKAKFLSDENISGVSKLIIIGDNFAEALKYCLIAKSEGIPHVVVTMSECDTLANKFLHIIKTDEESLLSCVKALLSFDEEIKNGYYHCCEAEGIYALQTAFASLLNSLPDRDFQTFFIKIHAHMSENLDCLNLLTENLKNCRIKRVESERLREIKAEIFAF
jgi:hypothetical protein